MKISIIISCYNEMWIEDIRMYNSHGMNPTITKIEKMLWKVPQYVGALFKR